MDTVNKNQLHGMVHCSGGAQTKILHFIDVLHVIKDNLFETPPLFKMIQEESNTSWKEMYEFSIWVTEWSCMSHLSLPTKLLQYQNPLMYQLKLLVE